MIRNLSALIGSALLMGIGCGQEPAPTRPQWLIMVSTDAPIPQFGDRLVAEVLDESGQLACESCRLVMGVGAPSDWPVSFGMAPPASGRALRMRTRLFRAALTGADGLPLGSALIDLIGNLPAAQGITTVSAALAMDCFGVVADLGARRSCVVGARELADEHELPTVDVQPPLEVGSWSWSQRAACSGPAPAAMVCVPGGVFLMGSSDYPVMGYPIDPSPEHVVRVSAFALDVDEMTVGEVRKNLYPGNKLGGLEPRLRNPDASSPDNACTWLGDSDATNDAMPLNCVGYDFATAACGLMTKRLPTEAEWEFAASNEGLDSTYPWGEDADVCAHAVISRGRTDTYFGGLKEDTACRPDEHQPWGPAAKGSDGDVTALGIRNMAGSLSEWLQDSFAAYDQPCWNPSEFPLQNPVCVDPSSTNQSLRGGSWGSLRMEARVDYRHRLQQSGLSFYLGFRCAVSL